ncbi:MAG: prenyltransferase/squalene oxidase repeat-containing protein [Alphaproteobacteria bacterium]|nr:prenyltransferase/squalene oxidase repeat-containing protein [Alphaproteobacteria bacterium]
MRKIRLAGMVLALSLLAASFPARADDFSPAIAKAADYLVKAQLPNGSLPGQDCSNGKCWPEMNVFGTALTLDILTEPAPVTDAHLAPLLAKAAAFLASKQSGGLWYYLVGNQTEGLWSYAPAFPPDLDDTAVASLALTRLTPAQVPDNLQKILALKRPDGTFPTWAENVGAFSTDERADCVVQINILTYLASRGKVPAQTCTNAVRHRQQKDFPACSVYYQSPSFYDALYLRAARLPGLECLKAGTAETAAPIGKNWTPSPTLSSQDLAFDLLSRLYLGYCDPTNTEAARQLRDRQRPDGSWPGDTLYTDGRPVFSFRSDAVTTAFALRALGEWQAHCAAKAP